jgi:hypothetical protein
MGSPAVQGLPRRWDVQILVLVRVLGLASQARILKAIPVNFVLVLRDSVPAGSGKRRQSSKLAARPASNGREKKRSKTREQGQGQGRLGQARENKMPVISQRCSSMHLQAGSLLEPAKTACSCSQQLLYCMYCRIVLYCTEIHTSNQVGVACRYSNGPAPNP